MQDWHFNTFCIQAKAIDLDLMGLRLLAYVARPLYLIESSQDRDEARPPSSSDSGAQADVPAHLVNHPETAR